MGIVLYLILFFKGKYSFLDGSIYDGEWNDDVRHGKGLFENNLIELLKKVYFFLKYAWKQDKRSKMMGQLTKENGKVEKNMDLVNRILLWNNEWFSKVKIDLDHFNRENGRKGFSVLGRV